jgi:hypothetical protein
MQQNTIRRIAQYVGVGAAVIVPALVVGQDTDRLEGINVSPGALLRAQDVQLLRDSLLIAADRISNLESRLNNNDGPTISKANIRPAITSTATVLPGAIATTTASCDAVGDIAIGCSCGGDTGAGTSGSPQIDQRIFVISNPSGSASSCTCQGQNVGTSQSQRIVAIVTCLRP